jgi:hypothetical protein
MNKFEFQIFRDLEKIVNFTYFSDTSNLENTVH